MDLILLFASTLLALIVLALVLSIMSYNRLRALEARCTQAHDDVDVQLKQRSDLLPNLVETVRSFVGQENHLLDTLHDVQTQMNSAATIHNKTKANANISNSLNNLFASLERIPELQSSSHYISLRAQILDIENKIAASRRFLNLATSEFNAKRLQFFGGIIASIAKIGERKGYSLGEERVFHDEAPVVKI